MNGLHGLNELQGPFGPGWFCLRGSIRWRILSAGVLAGFMGVCPAAGGRFREYHSCVRRRLFDDIRRAI